MSFKQTNIFEFLIDTFTSNIDNIKDTRRQREDIKYSLKDIILSAFSVFYFQSKSWLSFQTKMETSRGSSNAQTMFGIDNIPSDNHVRNILDTIKPDVFKKVYDLIVTYLHKIGVLKKFKFMDKYLLVALDGTQYHSSKNISCKCCQTKTSSDTGEVNYYHTAITPTIVNPNIKRVLPLMQEFISNNDGDKKQDCEVNASKRWLDSFIPPTEDKIILLGDDLYSRYPMIEKVMKKGHSFIFVSKEKSHKALYKTVESYKQTKSCKTFTTTKIHNGKKQILTYNWINKILLNGNTEDNIEVNWCELTITNLDGKQLHCFSFVTDLNIDTNNIEDIIIAGRTRWKIENENNNILKTKGYHLEHNFGHGKENLSQTLCTLNILAYLFHTVQDLTDDTYIELREHIGAREEFFTGINFLTTMFNFKSFDKMIEFILLSRQTDENIDMKPYIM
ncbi:MAG: transposase [Campylobacterota bacterium]|nr:transposase [Campylobacterota bacterium]MEA3499212.1 transposase [Campylobacterota bacterium]